MGRQYDDIPQDNAVSDIPQDIAFGDIPEDIAFGGIINRYETDLDSRR